MNNLLVCAKISAGGDSENGNDLWERRDEVLDLFSVYYWKSKDEAKTKDLQQIFKIDDAEAEVLRQAVDDGSFGWVEETKDEEIFF